MITQRGPLLARLHEASVGLSAKETIEQSNCFVFSGGNLTTFNDSIMVRVASPLDFDMVVNAADLMGMISKCPDDEINIYLTEGEVRIKGKRRTAGLAVMATSVLPIDGIPAPDKWHRLGEGVLAMLQQAARTCSDDSSKYLATCVHVMPDRIQACDMYRVLRVDGPTGFPSELLIPASSVQELDGMEILKTSVGAGWVHFKTASGAVISVRCSHEPYHKDMDQLFASMGGEKITLPATLADMVERAEVFSTAAYDAKVGVRIADNELVLTSRKDSGWYKEKKSVQYAGRPLVFEINPKFLVEILKRTRDVVVDDTKMKIASGNIQFMVVLAAKEAPKVAPKPAPAGKALAMDGATFNEDDIPF